jgi:very-short-patch-repair endonuclease
MSLNINRELREIAKIVCRDLRHKPTNAENLLWKKIRNRNFLSKKFLRQHPIFIDTIGKESFYVADFYCHEEKLVIELDGKIHQYSQEKDDLRTEIIKEKGLSVIRFKNEEVENNIDEVLKVLERIITHPCLSGRQAKSLS